MFCCTLLYVHFSIAIILMGKRELIALLNLSSWCLVMVERLFLTVPRGCLQFVIVVFPDHTHLLLLKVTNVYQVIEYSRMASFKSFVKQVTEARREGDNQPSLSVMALLMKLIGNAAFGGTNMNKQKHKQTKYVQGSKKGWLAINNPRFEKLDEIDANFFEVEFRKSTIALDNPLQLGLAIYITPNFTWLASTMILWTHL